MVSSSEERKNGNSFSFFFCFQKSNGRLRDMEYTLLVEPQLDYILQIIKRAENIDSFVFRLPQDHDSYIIIEETGRKFGCFLPPVCSFQRDGVTYESYDAIDYRLCSPWKLPKDIPRRLDFSRHLSNYEKKMNFLIGLLPESGRNEDYWIQVDADTKKRVKSDAKSSVERCLANSPIFERQVLNVVFEMVGWSSDQRKRASKRPRPE
jgi:hypothetical protein